MNTLCRFLSAAAALLCVALPSSVLAGDFHLGVDRNLGSTGTAVPASSPDIPMGPTRGATADNPAEPGGDESAEALRVTLERLQVRRTMLTAHQVLAWTSLSTLFAAETVGLVNRVALQTGSIGRSEMEPQLAAHRVLASTSIGSYYSAGVMAWLAPGPGGTLQPGDKGFSKWKNTRDVHIALSIAHNITMGLTVATGALMANALPAKHWDGMVATHTLMALSTGFLMIPAAVIISRF